MNIDIESIGLLSLILQDSPMDRQLILCILARSNTVPTRITFNPNTDYPTFYGYSNSRIPFYLMGKGVISNVPREGYTKRLITSHYLSYAETIINKAKNWDIHQKGMSISKFITLDNKTTYKDAEVFLIFRDKALGYIKDYASSHKEETSSFLGAELSGEVFKTVTNSDTKKPEDNYKAEIEAWLASKDNWTIRKIWQVVSTLNSEWQLRDQDIFKIPIEKFVKDWVDNEGELEAILTNLHNRKIIEVSRKLGETPPSNDPNKPEGSIWTTIDDQPEIIRREDTQVEIFPKKFSLVVNKLESFVTEKPKEIQNEDLKERYAKAISQITTQQHIAPTQSSSVKTQQRFTKRELRKEINRIIKNGRFGKKEKDYLKFLSNDFEPKTIEEISRAILTKDCKHLKGRVQKKIKGSGFSIKTIKASGWGSKSQYQLEYLPAPAIS